MRNHSIRLMVPLALLLQSVVSSFAQPQYKDVAPIFFSKCASCHHDGGPGHHPFTNYTQTAAYASLIQNALVAGTMPPWSPDTTYTRFFGERTITPAEKTAILDWVAANTPPGDTTLAPPPPVFGTTQLNGVASMELQIPNYTSTASSTDKYVCFSLPTNLTQDRYLRAFEIVPGNEAIVHHVIINVDSTGNTSNNLSGTCYNPPGDFSIGGYTPGAAPTILPGQAPLKLGMRIKAGSKIVLQIHYPAGSAGQVDSTRIRMYFYPQNETGIRPVQAATPLQNWNLNIPANSVTPFTATYQALPVPVSVLATFPHSHLLCKSIVNYAWLGNDTVKLIRINDWDFEWQGFYTYKRPVKIPAGYQLFARHVYDNTLMNPNNPNNPPQTVTAGLSTTDEMLFDGFLFTTYLPGDELIDIESLLVGDSLLNTGTGLPGASESTVNQLSMAFPNPSSDLFNIRLLGEQWGGSILEISDLSGRKVEEIRVPEPTEGSSMVVWNHQRTTGQAGLYFYKVISKDLQTALGKLVVVKSR
ncbi:MAG: T9SS type A sorting domain-containing protein [Bacteroidia bacterium]